ncbi:hypothetical protein GCM10027404_32140 [Arthrobacter tumbae]|uniref:DUF6993 domain-containing protein n=1 Tax=Arthrobacter tumbae TaxID=163874 RepID=UPI001EF8A3A3|nr:hypothetical protein [Arthrobacter tumbae]MBM7783267.1 hypothetical protein [Arthrobacter tumbae]
MRGHQGAAGIDIRRARSAALLCFLCVGIVLAAGGCGTDAAGSPSQALRVAPVVQSPDPAVSAAPNPSTVDAFTAGLEDSLTLLAAETANPEAEALRAAFESAGADPDSVEVSIDTTPTGLEVDAMTAAAPFGETCVFGHIRSGASTVTQLPVLSNGLCFVGDQR